MFFYVIGRDGQHGTELHCIVGKIQGECQVVLYNKINLQFSSCNLNFAQLILINARFSHNNLYPNNQPLNSFSLISFIAVDSVI